MKYEQHVAMLLEKAKAAQNKWTLRVQALEALTERHCLDKHKGPQRASPPVQDLAGKRIKRLRLKIGCPQSDFAKMVGVTQSCLSQWENGRVTPPLIALLSIERLAGELGLTWIADQATRTNSSLPPIDIQASSIEFATACLGLQARVASQLGISRSVVSRVFHGKKSSRRVKAAIEVELRKAEGIHVIPRPQQQGAA